MLQPISYSVERIHDMPFKLVSLNHLNAVDFVGLVKSFDDLDVAIPVQPALPP